MSAAEVDLELDQGSTWAQPIEWVGEDEQPIDPTGLTLRMQVRRKMADRDTGDPVLSLTSEDGGIVVDPEDETFTFMLTASAAVTAGIPAGRYVYDVEFVVEGADDPVDKLMRGALLVIPEVTRG